MLNKRQRTMMPAQVLTLGFAIIIIIGTVLLMLPTASAAGQWTDPLTALFTATTSVCVTGLVTVPTYSHWSVAGQWIILLLVELGGLGFMTFATMAILLAGRRVTLKRKLLIQEALSQNTPGGVTQLVRQVFFGTFLVQGAGALLLALRFCPEYGLARGIYYGIFHSISAFCNAGLDILGPDSLIPYAGDTYVNTVVVLLIVLGGLGYVVWLDVCKALREAYKPSRGLRRYCYIRRVWRHCSLYSKLVLTMTAGLILLGWLGFIGMEWNNPETLGGMPIAERLQAAFFQSVTTRTAGFAGIAQGGLTDNSKVLSSILMFIGGSSGGTAGGIKTVTVAVMLLTIGSYIRGHGDVEVFSRRIAPSAVRRAFSLGICAFLLEILFTMVIGGIEGLPFVDVLFEVASAIGTTGLSVGITAGLTPLSQILLILLMYIGRLGPLTVMIALRIRQEESRTNVRCPEEEVMIG